MATRSMISRALPNGTFEAVSCMYDGDQVGEVLRDHYTDVDSVKQLIAGGDMSSLGNHYPNTSSRIYSSMEDLLAGAEKRWADYLYVRSRNGRWRTIRLS